MADETQTFDKAEDEIWDEACEDEYRRGYSDGFIVALEGFEPGEAYERAFRFWQTSLPEWVSGPSIDSDGRRLSTRPPRLGDGGHSHGG